MVPTMAQREITVSKYKGSLKGENIKNHPACGCILIGDVLQLKVEYNV